MYAANDRSVRGSDSRAMVRMANWPFLGRDIHVTGASFEVLGEGLSAIATGSSSSSIKDGRRTMEDMPGASLGRLGSLADRSGAFWEITPLLGSFCESSVLDPE